MALIGTIKDDFQNYNGSGATMGQWTYGGGNNTFVVFRAGQATFLSQLAVQYSAMIVGLYDLQGSSAFIQVVTAGNQSIASHETIFYFDQNTAGSEDANNKVYVTINSGTIGVRKVISGVNSAVTGTISYNPLTMQFIRFRESGGTTFVDTAPDGKNWTNQWSFANLISVTGNFFGMQEGNFSTETQTTTSIFDNFNVLPPEYQTPPPRIPNRNVGPGALRHQFKRSYSRPVDPPPQSFKPWTGTFGITSANDPTRHSDDFNKNYIDVTAFSTALSNDGTQVIAQNNRLEITHNTGAQYNRIDTYGSDFTGQTAMVQVLDVGNQSLNSHEAQLQLRLDGNNMFYITCNQGSISAYKWVGGVQTQIGGSVTYNAVTHAWWRIREQGGTIFFETAPDPSAIWTTQWTLANPFAITSLLCGLVCGCYLTEASGSHAYFDNFYFPPYADGVKSFTNDVARKPTMYMFYQQWGSTGGFQNFLPGKMDAIYERGMTPMITWEPWVANGGTSQSTYSLANIIAGNFDSYITAFAQAAAAWGKPFYMRFAHEMNGNWYPWSEQVNGNSAGQYATAWQHVYTLFTASCTNAKWVWCPNSEFSGSTALTGLYPGDSYVDWVGIDAYNQGTDGSGGGWVPLTPIITSAYNKIVSLTSKPMMLGEIGSSELGGTKNDWITSALTYEIYNFPAIQHFIWFNWTSTPNWWIESSPNATAAFRAAVQNEPPITYGPVRVANNRVGPVVLRRKWRRPYSATVNLASAAPPNTSQFFVMF